MNDVFRWRRREVNHGGEYYEVGDRHLWHDVLQGSRAALILNDWIQKTATGYAVYVGPLRFILRTKDDAIVVLGLNAQYASGRQNGVVDFLQTAVGTGQNEIVQNIRASFVECASNAHSAKATGDDSRDMTRRRTKDQRQQQRSGDGKYEGGGANARDSRFDGRIRRERRQRDQRQAGHDNSDEQDHLLRLVSFDRQRIVTGHVLRFASCSVVTCRPVG